MTRIRVYLFLLLLTLVVGAPAQSDRSDRTELQNQSLVNEFRATADTGELTLGHVLFVDSSRGTSVAPGTPSQPFSTIGAALSRLHALEDVEGTNFVYDNVIYVYPEHAESITAASALSGNTVTGLYVALDGTKIIGLGDGSDVPTITFTTANTAAATIAAANVTIENIKFSQGITALAQAISVTAAADYLTLKDIEFTKTGTLATDTVDWINVAAGADDLTFDGIVARFATTGTSSVTLIEFAGAVARPTIQNIRVTAAFSDAVIDGDGAWTGATFLSNHFGTSSTPFTRTVASTEYTDYGTPDGGAWNYEERAITMATGTTGAATTHEVLTVTGDVHVRMLALITTTLVSASSDTISFGAAPTGTSLIGATDADTLAAGDIWVDATPADLLEGNTWTGSDLEFFATNGTDYGYDVDDHTIDSGVITFYVWWRPILDGGSLVTADGTGTL